MYVIEWVFLPEPGREDDFVAAYGPDGVWMKLFRCGDGFMGTELRALPEQPGWFRTIDCWESMEKYLAFREQYAARYAEIDAACAALTAREVPV